MGLIEKFRKPDRAQKPKILSGLETWTGQSTSTYKFHKNIQNEDLEVFYQMEQKSKHSDNRRPSYENLKLKRSYGQKNPK